MDKEALDRIAAAPKRILVQVKRSHILACQDCKSFTISYNPITLALADLGWTAVSVSMFNAFIGHPGTQIYYKPETETSAWIQAGRHGQWAKPFIAGFNRA